MQQRWRQQHPKDIEETDIGPIPETWSAQQSQAQTVSLPLAGFTISDGKNEEGHEEVGLIYASFNSLEVQAASRER